MLIFDASMPFDLDALHAQALELMLRRAGLRTLALTPAIDPTRLGARCACSSRERVVLTGRRASLDAIGRLVYAVRARDRRASPCSTSAARVPDSGASTVSRLGDRPLKARDAIVAHLDARAWGRMPATRGRVKAAAGVPRTGGPRASIPRASLPRERVAAAAQAGR